MCDESCATLLLKSLSGSYGTLCSATPSACVSPSLFIAS
jgi:hypothetical protein